MSVLSQRTRFNNDYSSFSGGGDEKKKPRLRIRRTEEGFVWFTKKGRRMTKPTLRRKQAVKLRKIRLKQIKFFRKRRG